MMQCGESNSPHGFARAFARRGIRCLPLHKPILSADGCRCSCGEIKCPSIGKHPRLSYSAASVDPTVLQSWFGSSMDANLGLLTGAASGIVVLDVDPRHGGDDALRSLTGKHGDLPETWRFLTGGAGEHIVFSAPAGVAVPNSAGLLGEGLDVRGERGLIVGPGSVHASGRRYEISVDHHPADVDLAAVPAWLLERMTAAPATAGRAKSSETVPAGVVPEGKRNQRLAQLIGRLLARGVDPIEAAQLVIGFNFRWCAPPLAEAEVLRVIDSIAGRQLRKLEA
jgi:hypothetical protein